MTTIQWTPRELWDNAAAADIDPDDCPIYEQVRADLQPKPRAKKVANVAKGVRRG